MGNVLGNGRSVTVLNRPLDYGTDFDFFPFPYGNSFSVPVDLAYGNVYGNVRYVPVLNSCLKLLFDDIKLKLLKIKKYASYGLQTL